MNRRWTVPAAAALVACFTSGWFLQSRLGAHADVYRQARLFETVLSHVRDYHVDSLPEAELYLQATDGLLKQLHDPYAARSVRELQKLGAGSREVHWSDASAHGTMLLARDSDLVRVLVEWFQRTLGVT